LIGRSQTVRPALAVDEPRPPALVLLDSSPSLHAKLKNEAV
jgi:hypothetical protein